MTNLGDNVFQLDFAKPLDEYEVVALEQFVHAVTQPNGQNILAVLSTEFCSNLAKDMWLLHKAPSPYFSPNHIAHRHDGDLCLA